MTTLLLESPSFTVIVYYWTNTVCITVLATPGPLYYHIMYLKVVGEFIKCYISFYHIFSSTAEDDAPVDPSRCDRTGSACSKRHFYTGFRKNAFSPTCSALLWLSNSFLDLNSAAQDAGLHLEFTSQGSMMLCCSFLCHTPHMVQAQVSRPWPPC